MSNFSEAAVGGILWVPAQLIHGKSFVQQKPDYWGFILNDLYY